MLIRSQSAYCFASFVLFVLLVVSSACGSEYRTWTDSTGKHKLGAKLESVKGGTVILVRESGQKVKIPLKETQQRRSGLHRPARHRQPL